MAFCQRCGNAIAEGAAFCNACGAQVNQQPTVLVPTRDPAAEEQQFLDDTYRILRWEQKAWSIAGTVFLIMGIVFAVMFFLMGIIFAVAGDYYMEALAGIYIVYSFLYGGMFIALGVVSKKAAEKIPQYLCSMYTNFRLTYDRCGSVGMLVFSAIFGAVAPIFFIINFVRMKANKDVVARIIARQQQF